MSGGAERDRAQSRAESKHFGKLDRDDHDLQEPAAEDRARFTKPRPNDADEAHHTGAANRLIAEIEPNGQPINGTKLLDRLAREFSTRVALSPHAANAAALWTLHTYCLDAARHSPILAWQSPTPRCGKTTALAVLAHLVYRALPTANVSPAAVYRTLERERPTLIIDEADSFLGQYEGMRGILNSGHCRETAYVIRCAPKTYEPQRFSTWGAKSVASIGKLPATLQDRSIVIPMQRADVEPVRIEPLLTLQSCCLRWAQDHAAELERAQPKLPVKSRAADNWRPLVAIADAAGGSWSSRARQAAVALSGERHEASDGEMLLADIKQYFAEHRADRVASCNLVAALVRLESRPWVEWRNNRALTVRQLARLLEPFGIHPRTIRCSDSTPKGYLADQFADAFQRYLNSAVLVPTEVSADKTCGGAVADGNLSKHLERGVCGGVADQRHVFARAGHRSIPSVPWQATAAMSAIVRDWRP